MTKDDVQERFCAGLFDLIGECTKAYEDCDELETNKFSGLMLACIEEAAHVKQYGYYSPDYESDPQGITFSQAQRDIVESLVHLLVL